jgi:O-Antigen ligase
MTVRMIAAAACLILIVAFQLQLLPFFSRLFIEDRTIWPFLFYGFWCIAAGTSAIVLFTRTDILWRTLPVLVVCAICIALALIHPLDGIAKNFIAAMVFFSCATVLASVSRPLRLLQISAAVTAISAVICLIDILFAEGLTNTAGRAAGLSIGPNGAAAGLLLGAAASYWAVPTRWRGYYLMIAGCALFATLSKSTLIAAIFIFGFIGIIAVIKCPFPRRGWLRHAVLACGLIAWIGVAFIANDRFVVATSDAYSGLGNAVSAFRDARKAIADSVPSFASATAHSWQDKFRTNALIDAISRRTETEGDVNSVSARWLLMERAWLSYQQEPLFGLGFAAAHALQPHNSILLFMLALGSIGILVPLAFVGLTTTPLYFNGWASCALPMATFTIIMISHDILLTPGLLAPVAFGLAASITKISSPWSADANHS